MTVQNDGDPIRLTAGGSIEAHTESLQYLWTPELDPLFWSPARVGVSSAWYSHVPFAHWIVGATRPRSLVELGTHNGVSYSAFCEAVVHNGLETRCYAVDTWTGDEQGGHYGEEVYWNLWRFHESRYGAFSQLLRCSFDAALDYFADHSVDILHMDGLHTYGAVRHDFEKWRPKLSAQAVVLFHDTNVRDREFGIWRLWDELRSRYPSFEFLHGHGLGVLQVGAEAMPQVVSLCALHDPTKVSVIRKRFSLLGERWLLDARERLPDGQVAAEAARREKLEKELLRVTGEARDLRAEVAWRAASEERLRTRAAHARAEAAEAIERASRAEERAIRVELRVGETLRSKHVPLSVRRTLRKGTKLAWWTLSLRLVPKLLEWKRRRHEALLITASSLFDADWYAARYPDVAAANVDPLTHYLMWGGVERRDPGPNFNTTWYLERYPDVKASRMNPLVHYLAHGVAEGREIRSVSLSVAETAASSDSQRLIKLLPILRCPETGARLEVAAEGTLRSVDGMRSWPIIAGRPNLFPGLDAPKFWPEAHLSNALPERALRVIHETTDGLVLNLSAGGSAQRFEHVVEVDAAVFRHTDVLADAHRLPFADCAFDAAVVLNAFEHYRDPKRVARELFRVLRPGGRVLLHTAFLQPLHEAPSHFYNVTRYGLEAWFEAFETETLHISDNFSPGHSIGWLASECEAALRQNAPAKAETFAATRVGHFISLWRGPKETRHADSIWRELALLPQAAQEVIAAGFEYVGRRPAE
jgi:ubiquinone/menaquinone biosynthesis C-methylase UbiE